MSDGAVVAPAREWLGETARGLRIVEKPCRHYDSSALSWPAHPELEGFMRATYLAHVSRGCAQRRFQASIAKGELAAVAKDLWLRKDAAPRAREMIEHARQALGKAQEQGDPRAVAVASFRISSAYRSAADQYRLWNARFPGYFAATAAQRAKLPGGPVGDRAARWLAGWIGVWLAAPGFSNHNAGRAVDLACRLTNGSTLTADRRQVEAWKNSWLHGWLVDNAWRFDFVAYEREPWHWDHRPGTASSLPRARSGVASEAEELVPSASGGRSAGPARYWTKQLRFALGGNTVEPLIDGPAAFRAIQAAIQSATGTNDFVYLLGWWVDPWVNLNGPGTCLLDLFERAGRRGVQVRALLWDAPGLLYRTHSDLHNAAIDAINALPNCHAQQDAGGGLLSPKSHHQKLLVVHGREGLVAVCGGIDVNADRLHDLPPPPTAYRADRPSVGWASSSGSGSGGSGNPLHDVHARVTGPTALPLMRMFLHRWWARSGDRAIDSSEPLRGRFTHPVPARTGNQYARVGATFNGVLRRSGRTSPLRTVDVQDIWVRSILAARRFIYIEEQYLLSDCAAEAIRTVLPRLAHVTLLISPSEITDLHGIWRRRLEFLERITRNNPHAGKLHVYTPAARRGDTCVRMNVAHVYVHSKMGVVDDELMLIGSANCNNRGWETDSELVTAAFEDAAGPSSAAGRLRTSLWAHHLGASRAAVADPIASRRLWDSPAAAHVCRYDPHAGRDRIDGPDSLVDPSDRRASDPCRTLLGAAVPSAAPAGRPIRTEVAY